MPIPVGATGMDTLHRPELIVWGSGNGTTFRALGEAIGQGLVNLSVPLVITDREDAGILTQAYILNHEYGLGTATEVINRRRYPGRPAARGQTGEEAAQTIEAMERHPRAILALLGCLRILHDDVLERYGWRPEWKHKYPSDHMYRSRIVNTHPGILSLTADTYGVNSSACVLEAGAPQTAHSLLAVGGPVDGGPVVAEHRIDVPNYRLTGPESMPAAAAHLFGLVQAVEKAHIAFDLQDYALAHQGVN